MSGTSNSNQLRKLKKAIQAEVHRKTGRRPQVLANNAEFQNAITYHDLAPNNAWYIVPNAASANRINQLYAKSTLNTLLQETNPKSPFSRRNITPTNIRKYMNFNSPPLPPTIINLTANGSPGAATLRPRTGLFSDQATLHGLQRLLESLPEGALIKIMMRPAAIAGPATSAMYIRKAALTPSLSTYFLKTRIDNHGAIRQTSLLQFNSRLAQFLSDEYGIQNMYYMGYRTLQD